MRNLDSEPKPFHFEMHSPLDVSLVADLRVYDSFSRTKTPITEAIQATTGSREVSQSVYNDQEEKPWRVSVLVKDSPLWILEDGGLYSSYLYGEERLFPEEQGVYFAPQVVETIENRAIADALLRRGFETEAIALLTEVELIEEKVDEKEYGPNAKVVHAIFP